MYDTAQNVLAFQYQKWTTSRKNHARPQYHVNPWRED